MAPGVPRFTLVSGQGPTSNCPASKTLAASGPRTALMSRFAHQLQLRINIITGHHFPRLLWLIQVWEE